MIRVALVNIDFIYRAHQSSHQLLDSDLNSLAHGPMNGCKQLMAPFLELIKGFQMIHRLLGSDLNCQSYHWLTIMQCF